MKANETIDFVRIGRNLLSNAGAAMGVVFLLACVSLVGDAILKLTPSLVHGLVEFAMAHAEIIASGLFVAITFPLIK